MQRLSVKNEFTFLSCFHIYLSYLDKRLNKNHPVIDQLIVIDLLEMPDSKCCHSNKLMPAPKSFINIITTDPPYI